MISPMENIEQKLAKRLQNLEEKFEYQDRTIETLNDVIIEQQAQINAMEEAIEKLHSLLATNLTQEESKDPPPPHY